MLPHVLSYYYTLLYKQQLSYKTYLLQELQYFQTFFISVIFLQISILLLFDHQLNNLPRSLWLKLTRISPLTF